MEHDENEMRTPEGQETSPEPAAPPSGEPFAESPAGVWTPGGPPQAPPPPSPWFAAGATPLPPPGGWWVPPAGGDTTGSAGGRSGRKLAVLVGVVALLAGGLGAGLDAVVNSTSNALNPSRSTTTLPRSNDSGVVPISTRVAQVASAVDPAVVDIDTTVASPVGNGTEAAAGTGMIISSSGLVLTNNHVVESATSIRVVISAHPGSYKAKVLGVDPTQDVALIKIESPPSGLAHVNFADSAKVTVGTSVVAIGNALGLGGKPSVSSGTITSTNRTITAGDELPTAGPETLHHLFETDAPIQSGDSGGPLVNLRGQVLGMDTAAASSDTTTGSLGFAIPINEARQIADAIQNHNSSSRITLGLTAFLGITEQPGFSGGGGFFGANSGSTSKAGVFISDVIAGSPAQAAGLVAGDSITSLDGTATNSIRTLQNAIRSHRPGQSVTVTYTDQAGASHTATVKLSGIPL
jgi:S1-C subfamily serine protease